MSWLFETSIFTPRLQCGYLEYWMYLTSVLSNLAYIFVYTLLPICFIFFYLYRGRNFSFSKWSIVLVVAFTIITCMNRLCYLAAYTWPAYRFIAIVEALSGVTAIAFGFVLPYFIKIAADTPTIHRIKNLENTIVLYKQLDTVLQSQLSLTKEAVLTTIEKKVDKKTFDDVQVLLNTLIQGQ